MLCDFGDRVVHQAIHGEIAPRYSAPACQEKRRQKTQAAWREAHPDY